MSNRWRIEILQFVILLLVQVLILNNIQFGGFINPYLYVMFILWLPFYTPRLILLLAAFLMGILIDFNTNSPGMHACASVLMAFFRPYILKALSPYDGYDSNSLPRIRFYGLAWFLKYAASLVAIHHVMYFYLEVFSFTDFFTTLFRALFNTIVTLCFIVLSQYVLYKK